MAELDDRMEREAKLALLLSRVGARQRRELEKLLGDPPDIRNVPDAWWAKSQKEIEDTLTAMLLLTFAASAALHGLDAARANARAEAWANRTGARIAREMVRNTRTGLRVSLRGIVVAGEPVRPADLRQVTLRWLGPTRWSNVAVTETTRAQHHGSEYGIELTTGLSPDDYWRTVGDGRVCFPAGTMVRTSDGDRPIESLRIGDYVATRSGFRKITNVMNRVHCGTMRTMSTSVGVVTSTSDHPFWSMSKQSWVAASDLSLGDTLQTFGNQQVELCGIADFSVGETDHCPSIGRQVSLLSGVTGGRSGMPVNAIDLNCNADGRDDEVNGITADRKLLDEIDSKSIKGNPHRGFWSSLARILAVARETAELAVRVSGLLAERLVAGGAFCHQWWSSAHLGAVPTNAARSVWSRPLLSKELFSASFAIETLGVGSLAGVRADTVSVSNGRLDGERYAALRAVLRDGAMGVGTCEGAIDAGCVGSHGRSQVELASTCLARSVLPATLPNRRRKLEDGIWDAQYHSPLAKGVVVYDISVETEHEFFANGLLVHNCHICAPLNGSTRMVWSRKFPEGPPSHPSCRCVIAFVGAPVKSP